MGWTILNWKNFNPSNIQERKTSGLVMIQLSSYFLQQPLPYQAFCLHGLFSCHLLALLRFSYGSSSSIVSALELPLQLFYGNLFCFRCQVKVVLNVGLRRQSNFKGTFLWLHADLLWAVFFWDWIGWQSSYFVEVDLIFAIFSNQTQNSNPLLSLSKKGKGIWLWLRV